MGLVSRMKSSQRKSAKGEQASVSGSLFTSRTNSDCVSKFMIFVGLLTDVADGSSQGVAVILQVLLKLNSGSTSVC